MSGPEVAVAASDKEPVIPFASAGEWEEWLHANHDRSPGIWMRLAGAA